MAQILCGISNVPFKCDHIPMTLRNREYNHPIFSMPQKRLLGLYSIYTKGELTDIDAYLLFVALLHSTDAVEFVVPTEVSTSTSSIIAANIGQLVRVIWETNAIAHPSFKQPRFYIRKDTANLDNIKIWIAAWAKNIDDFKEGIDYASAQEKLTKIENTLSRLIFSPEAGQIKLASAVAEWADKAAEFPVTKRDNWKSIIRKCYNLEAMFSTPKEDLLELKAYCEENLEAGSIHFHTLMKTIKTGIANHNDFLGLSSLDSGDGCGYTLLTTDNTRQEAAMLAIVDSAPSTEPVQANYPDKISFIRAKLAYKQAVRYNAVKTNTVQTSVGEL